MTSPAAKNLDESIRRLFQGQACGIMLGAMARIGPSRPASRPATTFFPMAVHD
jgi:hypothetical protein